jgi:glycerol-3-phosphate dehydrogenase (NAD(P)+)
MAIVTIVGAGLMGTAMAYPLADNGHTVRLVGTHLDGESIQSCKQRHYHPRLKRALPPGVRACFVEEIADAFEGTEIVVSGVNSLGVRWIGRTIAPLLRPGQIILAVTKGLEITPEGDLRILPDVLENELPAAIRGQVRLAAVGGPCIAGELAGRRHSCVIFGSRHPATLDSLGAAFRTSYYHVWTTTDLVGLEYCAALKNAYALCVGLAAGLLEREGGVDAAGAHMHNLVAAVFAQACTEIDRMLHIVGGSPQFAVGLPGPGDLHVTCQGGRTARLGKLLGLGRTYPEARRIMAGETLESAEIVRVMGQALPRLVARGLLGPEELPLLRSLIDVVVHGRPAELPVAGFFQGLLNAAGR